MSKKTALHQAHLDGAAKLVRFSGYCMPLHYGSVLSEHQAARDSAAMFDMSHLSLVDLRGSGVTDWLRLMLSNDVGKLTDHRAMYTCLCAEDGGVIDDLLAFRISQNHYRLSIDRARLKNDIAWFDAHRAHNVELHEISDTTIISVQGPDGVQLVDNALRSMGLLLQLNDMPRFSIVESGRWLVSRTGCSGEDGVEIMLPDKQALNLWRALAEQGVSPAGLGARDTLRLEAGFGLYGQDIDKHHSPAESGIAHAIDISDNDRAFIGRTVLEDHKLFGGRVMQVGLELEGQGLIRKGAQVELVGESIGAVTSGSYSPSRAASIGLARVSRSFLGSCDVAVSDRLQPAHITSLPFVPHGLARE